VCVHSHNRGDDCVLFITHSASFTLLYRDFPLFASVLPCVAAGATPRIARAEARLFDCSSMPCTSALLMIVVGGFIRQSPPLDDHVRCTTAGRANEVYCSGGLFPDDNDPFTPPATAGVGSRAWRKGTLERGRDYWWREPSGGDPEIILHEPSDEWKAGTLASGREYLWRSSASGGEDDPDIVLLGDEDDSSHQWKVGTLKSGKRYLWRDNPDDPDDPEIKMWSESQLKSGKPFWYDEDGEISLSDPFAAAAGKLDDSML
jgi:hypothetical protein